MSSEEIYLDIIDNLRIIDPKMCKVLEYLRPYYVYHKIPSKRQDAIRIIESRHPSKPSYENYYPSFFEQMPNYEKYSDKREFCVDVGKYNLEMTLKVNPDFKEEYDRLISKIENIKKARNYQTAKKMLDQVMMQMVYRCAASNALYWGYLMYTTDIYKYLFDRASEIVKDYKNKIIDEINISKKN